jgi:hypothetical protein
MMNEKAEKVTGGCLCGAVRYESSEPPYNVGYCHCRMCQKALGNLFCAYAFFLTDKIRFTTGQPKFYQSSDIAERGFCPNCGTPLMFRYFGSDHYTIHVGSLDHPEEVRPNEHSGIESQVPWLTIHDDLPRMRTEDLPSYIEAKSSVNQEDK